MPLQQISHTLFAALQAFSLHAHQGRHRSIPMEAHSQDNELFWMHPLVSQNSGTGSKGYRRTLHHIIDACMSHTRAEQGCAIAFHLMCVRAMPLFKRPLPAPCALQPGSTFQNRSVSSPAQHAGMQSRVKARHCKHAAHKRLPSSPVARRYVRSRCRVGMHGGAQHLRLSRWPARPARQSGRAPVWCVRSAWQAVPRRGPSTARSGCGRSRAC